MHNSYLLPSQLRCLFHVARHHNSGRRKIPSVVSEKSSEATFTVKCTWWCGGKYLSWAKNWTQIQLHEKYHSFLFQWPRNKKYCTSSLSDNFQWIVSLSTHSTLWTAVQANCTTWHLYWKQMKTDSWAVRMTFTSWHSFPPCIEPILRLQY